MRSVAWCVSRAAQIRHSVGLTLAAFKYVTACPPVCDMWLIAYPATRNTAARKLDAIRRLTFSNERRPLTRNVAAIATQVRRLQAIRPRWFVDGHLIAMAAPEGDWQTYHDRMVTSIFATGRLEDVQI